MVDSDPMLFSADDQKEKDYFTLVQELANAVEAQELEATEISQGSV